MEKLFTTKVNTSLSDFKQTEEKKKNLKRIESQKEESSEELEPLAPHRSDSTEKDSACVLPANEISVETKPHNSGDKEENEISSSMSSIRKEAYEAKQRELRDRIDNTVRILNDRVRSFLPAADEILYPGEKGKKELNKIIAEDKKAEEERMKNGQEYKSDEFSLEQELERIENEERERKAKRERIRKQEAERSLKEERERILKEEIERRGEIVRRNRRIRKYIILIVGFSLLLFFVRKLYFVYHN